MSQHEALLAVQLLNQAFACGNIESQGKQMPDKCGISPDWPSLPNWPNALNFETHRLQTFQVWGHSHRCPVSPLTIAKEGFYATGNGDEVECFSCKQRHTGWKASQVPHQIHQQISPGCALFSENEPRGDVQVRPNIPIPVKNSPTAAFATSRFQTFQDIVLKRGIQASSDTSDFFVYFPGVRIRHPRNRASSISQERHGNLPFTARHDFNGVDSPQHLYGEFSSVRKRRNSYRWFPLSQEQLTQKLIQHGFFYVGHDDIVLCYSCGLAVHKWRPCDDPKTVHVRWSGSCHHLHCIESPLFIQRTIREQEVVGAAPVPQ